MSSLNWKLNGLCLVIRSAGNFSSEDLNLHGTEMQLHLLCGKLHLCDYPHSVKMSPVRMFGHKIESRDKAMILDAKERNRTERLCGSFKL